MKKYLCLLVALILVTCLMPVFAAEEACPACGSTATWKPMPNTAPATVTGSGKLTAFDSQTDDHTVADGIYGKLSFHRADLEIYAMTLRPGVAGVYYQSRILCDEKAAQQVATYGVALNVFEAPGAENMETTTKAS